MMKRRQGMVDIVTCLDARHVTPANLIARQFDADFGSASQQFDRVAFLDGQEAEDKAIAAGLDEFRRSWRRPKWHVLVQNTPPGR